MREPSCFKGKIPVGRVDADFREFADRIEAAIKREREAVGNAAKMRDALETISKCDISKEEDCYTLYDACEAALSAPPRNCDLYATPKEAGEAFISESCENPCGNCTVSDECHNPLIHECGINWLFAEAKGETKCK
jgi:hypothetical protein